MRSPAEALEVDSEFQIGALRVLGYPVTLLWPRGPGGCFQRLGPVKESDLPAVTQPQWEPKARGAYKEKDKVTIALIFGSPTHSSIHKISPGHRLSTSGPVWGAGHIERTRHLPLWHSRLWGWRRPKQVQRVIGRDRRATCAAWSGSYSNFQSNPGRLLEEMVPDADLKAFQGEGDMQSPGREPKVVSGSGCDQVGQCRNVGAGLKGR